jgi:hypothetical protein
MKGLGRGAALLGASGLAGIILALGPGAGVALAINDGNGGNNGGLFPNGIMNDKGKDNNNNCINNGKDGKDGKNNGGIFPNGIFGDKNRNQNCVVGVGVGAGVGAGAGGPGGVAAGGGGMADPGTALPLAGAGLGAVLLSVGYVNRRRQQGAR